MRVRVLSCHRRCLSKKALQLIHTYANEVRVKVEIFFIIISSALSTTLDLGLCSWELVVVCLAVVYMWCFDWQQEEGEGGMRWKEERNSWVKRETFCFLMIFLGFFSLTFPRSTHIQSTGGKRKRGTHNNIIYLETSDIFAPHVELSKRRQRHFWWFII